MVYYNILNDTLSSDSGAVISALPFYIIGAIISFILIFLGHALTAALLKEKNYKTSFNPLKSLGLYLPVSLFSFLFFGVGWTKAPDFISHSESETESKGKSAAIAVGGSLFCFIICFIVLNIYPFTSLEWLGSLLMGIVTAGVSIAVFNMLPFPGLNGGKVLRLLLPAKASAALCKAELYSMLFIALAVFLLARSGAVTVVIREIINFISFTSVTA